MGIKKKKKKNSLEQKDFFRREFVSTFRITLQFVRLTMRYLQGFQRQPLGVAKNTSIPPTPTGTCAGNTTTNHLQRLQCCRKARVSNRQSNCPGTDLGEV